jgi:hypothetical protein
MKNHTFITNINTFSALLDRLITEKIKEYFFVKNNKSNLVKKQRIIISSINKEIIETFILIKKYKGYKYLKENRTFNYNAALLVKLFSKLTHEDLNIGMADNELAESIKGKNKKKIVLKLKKSRNSLENRAVIKNQIDLSLAKIFKF